MHKITQECNVLVEKKNPLPLVFALKTTKGSERDSEPIDVQVVQPPWVMALRI